MATDARLGTAERPVRAAVVGAGPAGFFTIDALLRRSSPVYDVDLFEALPTPFGLVRAGVAPDHQKIKSVTKTFDKTAKSDRFRFLGNVRVGRDIGVEELSRHYDQIVYAIGSSSDRRLGIPGEELTGCHAATAFVGWYNAHPDFKDFRFRLDTPRAVIVGAGNVALDIARVLLRRPDELAETDIADHALRQLREAHVRDVVLLARRGPAQAAFGHGELADIAALEGVSVHVDRGLVEAEAAKLDELDAPARRNVELLLDLARRAPEKAERSLRLEFLASPVELLGDDQGKVKIVRAERTELVSGPGRVEARGTGEHFDIEAGVVFRSIGYHGVPLPGVPYDDKKGVIPNQDGRVINGHGRALPGVYAVGWIRRGPLGVIGTNKADGQAVAELMVEDVPMLVPRTPEERSHAAVDALLASRGVRVATYTDWGIIDQLEVSRGKTQGKVREKLTSVEQMLAALPPKK